MSRWLLAIIIYCGLAILSFLPVLVSLVRSIKLFNGGDGPEKSPLFSEEAKMRLKQNHTRMIGTLCFWKKQAELYKRFHYYALGWVIPSSILIPFLSQAIDNDPYSKWFLSVVSALSAALLSFHQWLKVEQNFKAFRQGESTYYDLRRRLLDRPTAFGQTEEVQLDTYFAKVEEIREKVRDAEIDNFPGSELPKVKAPGNTQA
jgi:hypothetical protein